MDLDSYVGKADEHESLSALRAQVDKVTAAIRSVVPQHAKITIKRAGDDEILGYVTPTATSSQPDMTFHPALAEPTSRDKAERVLRRDGLSDAWWVESERASDY